MWFFGQPFVAEREHFSFGATCKPPATPDRSDDLR